MSEYTRAKQRYEAVKNERPMNCKKVIAALKALQTVRVKLGSSFAGRR